MNFGIQGACLYRIFNAVIIGTVICVSALPGTLFAADRVTEMTVKEAVEKVAEKVVEKAAQKATEKAELTAKRPDEWRGPTKV